MVSRLKIVLFVLVCTLAVYLLLSSHNVLPKHLRVQNRFGIPANVLIIPFPASNSTEENYNRKENLEQFTSGFNNNPSPSTPASNSTEENDNGKDNLKQITSGFNNQSFLSTPASNLTVTEKQKDVVVRESVSLPNETSLPPPSRQIIYKNLTTSYTTFKPRINAEQKKILLELVFAFNQTASKHNVTFFLYGGSLLGSYRNHDIIPWDDDVDVVVPLAQQQRLDTALRSMPDRYVTKRMTNLWKVYLASSRSQPQCFNLKYDYSWPFIDVFFFAENKTHIWDVRDNRRLTFNYMKTDIFPLRQRPFGSLLLPAPFNTYNAILRTFDVTMCASNGYSHRCESLVPIRATVNCSLLYPFYPFVRRFPTPEGCLEVSGSASSEMRYLDQGKPCRGLLGPQQ